MISCVRSTWRAGRGLCPWGCGLSRASPNCAHSDRIDEAPDLLAAVYNHFTEGLGTADLQRAKRLFDESS